MGQTCNVSLAHKVIAAANDRGRCGLLSDRLDRAVAAGADRIKRELCQISCQCRDTSGLAAGVTPLDSNVTALLDSRVMESLRPSIARISGRLWVQNAHP